MTCEGKTRLPRRDVRNDREVVGNDGRMDSRVRGKTYYGGVGMIEEI
jgi:hypothetical protein